MREKDPIKGERTQSWIIRRMRNDKADRGEGARYTDKEGIEKGDDGKIRKSYIRKLGGGGRKQVNSNNIR